MVDSKMREADLKMRTRYTKDANVLNDVPELMSIIKQGWYSSGSQHLCGSSHMATLFSISEGCR